MRARSPSRFTLALVLAAAMVPGLAQAAPQEAPPVTVDTLTDDGLAAYRARDFRHATEKFLQAYAMQPDPNLLFNLGRCYEALGDNEAAREKYRLFLASPDIDPVGRRRAEDAVRLLAARTTPVPAVGERRSERSSETGATDEAPGRRGRAVLPLVGIGVGGAALAAGAVIYALGVRDHQQVTGAPGYGVAGDVSTTTEAEAHRLVDAGRTKKVIGGTALAVGGAVLAASVAVMLLLPERHAAEGVALGVAPAPGGGSVLLAGRF
jgi:hypothetical protein